MSYRVFNQFIKRNKQFLSEYNKIIFVHEYILNYNINNDRFTVYDKLKYESHLLHYFTENAKIIDEYKFLCRLHNINPTDYLKKLNNH